MTPCILLYLLTRVFASSRPALRSRHFLWRSQREKSSFLRLSSLSTRLSVLAILLRTVTRTPWALCKSKRTRSFAARTAWAGDPALPPTIPFPPPPASAKIPPFTGDISSQPMPLTERGTRCIVMFWGRLGPLSALISRLPLKSCPNPCPRSSLKPCAKPSCCGARSPWEPSWQTDGNSKPSLGRRWMTSFVIPEGPRGSCTGADGSTSLFSKVSDFVLVGLAAGPCSASTASLAGLVRFSAALLDG